MTFVSVVKSNESISRKWNMLMKMGTDGKMICDEFQLEDFIISNVSFIIISWISLCIDVILFCT